LDVLDDDSNGDITLLRLLVGPAPGTSAPAPDEEFTALKQEMKRTKWLDPITMELVFDRYPWLGVNRSEIITAFCALLHPIMSKVNALAYSKANITNSVTHERYIPYAASVADLLLERFDPDKALSDEELASRAADLREKIADDVEDRTSTELLYKMIDIVNHVLKTNLYQPDRYALGFRLDPAIMEIEGESGETSTKRQRELPYGVFFVHGRRFNAYHTRFRDIARGGLRLVSPTDPERFALESARQYDECYGLAFAQQMKNKDIPEGGSKAVNLIDLTGVSSESWRNFVVRKSVKAFADTMLDLILTPSPLVVDRWGRKEVIYLGPDEQVIPDDINWIVNRAAQRGYGTPSAFMSSKPRAGINHKEYGVTSEGVNVYLDVALRHSLGIDPTKQSFRVKLTGGPDGDVAGNEIRILLREYGEAVLIVGIADHSGCAEDPDGLDHAELLRLVNSGLSIGHFDPERLGERGALHLVNTNEGVHARNTMHNRVEAEAFIPAGGRPNTIDKNNYRSFILPSGKPSAPLIVEGANLFLTSEARKGLYEEAGVTIVKDSSANKGGVLTSSYEIIAAMLLTEDEFFLNKDQIVQEVLEKVRGYARMEALLLFREFDNYTGTFVQCSGAADFHHQIRSQCFAFLLVFPESLPEISGSISDTINLATDALTDALDSMEDDRIDALLPLFR
jgi:glutamate dehydrogenase